MQTPSGSFLPQREDETPSSVAALLSLQQPRFNRLLGTLFAVMMLALYCVSLPVYFQRLLIVCTSAAACALDGALTPEGLQTLSIWHLSASAYAVYTLIVSGIVFAIWFSIGCVILWRKSDDRMAVLTALFLISFNISIENGSVSLLPQVYPWWTFPVKLCLSLALVASLLFCYMFPTGRFAPRWTGWCLMLGCPFLAVIPDGSPLNVSTWPGWLAALLSLALACTICITQVYRYRRMSNTIERLQIKWVVFGIAIAVIGNSALSLFGIFFPVLANAGPLNVVGNTLYYLVLLAMPFSIGLSILRYKLWNIDIIINRTLVYGFLTAGVIGIYILVVGYLGSLFRTTNNLLISLLATGLVAVLFQPLRERLQQGINRLLYGQRDEPYTVITHLSKRLEATPGPETILPTIVETVAQTLKLPYVAILLKYREQFEVVACYGRPVEGSLTIPLQYQGETIGRFDLSARAAGETFAFADLHLLNELARHTALAAHTVLLTHDLRRSRERVVTTREEERRRLRRDLHDGLGATLAALHLQVGATRVLVRQDSEAAEKELLEIQEEIRFAITDIRRLVYALRPPTLDELGLIAALQQQATEYSLSPGASGTAEQSPRPLSITVIAPEKLPALSAAIEVAIYRIVQEALTNVVRHARASTCTIRLSLEKNHQLQVEITDDGVGFPTGTRAGVGLHSMRERAEELDGCFHIERKSEDGTSIFVRFPISQE